MDGIPIPFLPYSLVNQEKMILLLDKIQTAIPEEISKADQILGHREEIQLESQRRAQQMLQEAKQQAEYMLGESELLKAVQLEAERVRQQVMSELQTLRQQTLDETEDIQRRAYDEARLVRESADEYAETVLKTLGRNLEEFHAVAKNAQKQLKRTRAEALQTQYPQAVASGSFVAGKPKDGIPRTGRSEMPPALYTPESNQVNV